MKRQYDGMRSAAILIVLLAMNGSATASAVLAQEAASDLPAGVETLLGHLGPHPQAPAGVTAAPEPDFDEKLAGLAGALAEDATYRLSSQSLLPSPSAAQAKSADLGASSIVDGDWTVVSNTKLIPYRAVCYLETTWDTLDQFGEPIVTIGTGTFVSPRVIVTSARNVHQVKHGGFCAGVRVYPGRNGSKKPYGSAASQTTLYLNGWTPDETVDDDLGFVVLPSPTLYFRVGYVMDYGTATDEKLKKWNLNSLGYPTPLDTGIKMRHDYETQDQTVLPSRFRYFHDAKAGCEGGPLFYVRPSDGVRQMVGFYSDSAGSGNIANSASRLTQHKLDAIEQVISTYP